MLTIMFAAAACGKTEASKLDAELTANQEKADAILAHVQGRGPKNLALDFAERWIGKVDPGAKCSPWTGSGTAIKGVDSVLCSKDGASVIIYCAAPFDAKPRCEMAADWTAQPQAQQPVAPKAK
ncbi:MAG: hypothetical protein EHM89_00240 [Acidobacteria bacterium]|nr:MAG: hypothetical protein EHM89_00240 [Acidobacteriota bacterium]